MGDFFISSEELWDRMARQPGHVRVFDVRRPQAMLPESRLLPGSRWRDHMRTSEWAVDMPQDVLIVVNCMHGHNVSQIAASALRASGRRARVLQGGIDAWCSAGFATVARNDLAPVMAELPSRWVTRLRPKIDRVACPWLIHRFIDPDAQFVFAEPDWVLDIAQELGAVAFDTPGAPVEHDGELCSFDTLIAKFDITDSALAQLALIVRGADTGRNDLAPEAAGLLAAAAGMSVLATTDHDCLRLGFPLYDALYARLRLAADETHGWQPMQETVR